METLLDTRDPSPAEVEMVETSRERPGTLRLGARTCVRIDKENDTLGKTEQNYANNTLGWNVIIVAALWVTVFNF